MHPTTARLNEITAGVAAGTMAQEIEAATNIIDGIQRGLARGDKAAQRLAIIICDGALLEANMRPKQTQRRAA